MWSRLNLRAQVSIAVLLPCLAVAIFSSLYFPKRLNTKAEEALEARARSLGALATAEIAPTLGFIKNGLANADDLDKVFSGVTLGGDVSYVGVLEGDGRTVIRTAIPGPDGKLQFSKAVLPLAEFKKPDKDCALDTAGELLVLRCLAKDQDAEGVFVAGFNRNALQAAQSENRLVGVWSGLIAVLAGLILAFVFSGALATPVAMVTQAAREVASGDVSVAAVQVAAAGEIQSMATSFNEMLANLRALVVQMVSLTGRLSNASVGLITASTDQEHVTSQQAAYAQQIAATFEELSRTAEQISASTDVVETAARRTNEAVEQAKVVMSQVVGGIREIRDESKGVAEAIGRLNADLQQVSKIAQVINAVAERSDLLALNAALEGTKAGEVGRGFSLVAAEMRKLAENVAVSARDIGRIVEQVQESGSQAVTKARGGVSVSDKGMAIANQAEELFERIVQFARGTTEAAQQIAVATRQQRQSSEQAVQGARNVADLVKQGVDATGRTTKIAQDLQTVSQALAEVTGKFRVKDSRAA
ncbi:MAG: methyl-accepting chemotaxis protein [Myxococcaceae bacterium]